MLADILCFYKIPTADHTKEGSYDFKKWSSLLAGLLGGSVGVLSIPKLSGRELTAAAQIPLLLAIVFSCSAGVLVTYLSWTTGSSLILKPRLSPPWILLACIVLFSGLSLLLGFMLCLIQVGSDSEREILLSRILPTSVAMLMLILIVVTVLVNVDHKRRYGKQSDDVESPSQPTSTPTPQTSASANNTAPARSNSHPSHPVTPRSGQAGSQTVAHESEPNDKTVNAGQVESRANDIQRRAERVSSHTDRGDNRSRKEGETVKMNPKEGNTTATIREERS
ncbi:hypothetical protein FRC07_002577 [Ceratobasidium sp. 392]|nr:hypothetical protein FRC07_002577 [Ceratobasidium sp. 392]